MDQLASNPPKTTAIEGGGLQATAAAPPQARTLQFSLRAMLIFTALVGCVLLLVLLKGGGVLVVVTGLTVTWLNSRGVFSAWQHLNALHRPIRTGWLLLVLSLFLPSFRACGNSDLVGWETGQACASMQFSGGWEATRKDMGLYALCTLLNLANLLFLATPLWVWRLRQGGGQLYTAFFGCAATAAWTAAAPDASGLLVGYYVWCLAQLCMLSAARPGSRTLIAMCLMATARVFLWPAEGNLGGMAVGPAPRPLIHTVAVTGTVTLDGTPLEFATVTFWPIGSEMTKPAVAVADAQGRFCLKTSVGGSVFQDGAMPGDYIATVSMLEKLSASTSELPEFYGQVNASPLRQTVVGGKPNVISFALSSSDSDLQAGEERPAENGHDEP
jgi:hypothetical protein